MCMWFRLVKLFDGVRLGIPIEMLYYYYYYYYYYRHQSLLPDSSRVVHA